MWMNYKAIYNQLLNYYNKVENARTIRFIPSPKLELHIWKMADKPLK